MAVKRRLSDLVSDLVLEESPKVTELQTLEVSNSVSPNLSLEVNKLNLLNKEPAVGEGEKSPSPTSELAMSQKHRLTESETSEVPKYLTYDRKEARLRFDQVTSLTNLTKLLNRRRKGRGERITDNTLIRVAVDLLLSKAETLGGMTEDEIRAGLKL
ncbi:MAG: hypothetical protein KME07_04490 [Pegethrix bostrychoides GSE-TBD4-15B]|jgi:hypothetical protein|uniref:Uncharacterized protein n=1 Tax=Pegethrix bostrychoides GSE-TBD4-15B TaxID=2839662 RepID=A0A951U3I4_9CYAN|nr:hypothetical protein [Pegethrix bostrychoides GSE-TBD4-15B]